MIDWLRRDREPERQAATVEIAGRVLPVEVSRNARARRLTLRLAADGESVRITLPRWCSEAEALAFAKARTGWLAQQAAKVPPPRDPLVDGLLFRGVAVTVEHTPGAPRRPRLEEDRIVLGGPAEGLAVRLGRWLEREALALMSDDAAHYCALAALAPAEVRLTRARRRWGSCSSEGILRINWRLIQAPDFVRRSVVAHEVAHLVHFDHSEAFHALLDRLYEGDVEEANRWLSRHGRELYCAFG